MSIVNKMFLRWMSKDLCLPSCRLVVFRAISSKTLFPWVTGRSHACFEERRKKCPRIFSIYQDRFFHESKQKVIDCSNSMLVCLIFGWKWLGVGGDWGGDNRLFDVSLFDFWLEVARGAGRVGRGLKADEGRG